jgi:hypothetical protein
MASTDLGPESGIGEFFLNDREALRSKSTDGVLDFNAVEAVVDVTHRYPEMFYPKET